MEARGYIYIMTVSAMLTTGCKKLYTPTIVSSGVNYLVVEGVINAGQDSTSIKLSRTINLLGKTTTRPELNATVTIESDQNVIYKLEPLDGGRYAAPALNLDNTRNYRLRIIVAGGRTYLSDFVPVKITPPIDTLRHEITSNSVNFYCDAHDPSNSTRYYRWDYVETYQYESQVESYFRFDSTYFYNTEKVQYRTPDQQVHICYVTDSSSSVVINSSAALQKDVISANRVAAVPSGSEKFYFRYSMLLKQYALTEDAYNFWSILKRNTEQIGSIFDALPQELKGNIHCLSDPQEPVIGYVSASTVTQKRVFVNSSEIPSYPPPQDCPPFKVTWEKGEAVHPYLLKGDVIPLAPVTSYLDPKTNDTAYSVLVTFFSCADCLAHNNDTNVQPSFWR